MCFCSWPCLPCCLVCYHSNLHYLPWQLITYTCPSSSLVNLCLYIPLWFSCVLSVFVFWLLSWFLLHLVTVYVTVFLLSIFACVMMLFLLSPNKLNAANVSQSSRKLLLCYSVEHANTDKQRDYKQRPSAIRPSSSTFGVLLSQSYSTHISHILLIQSSTCIDPKTLIWTWS